MLGSRVASLVEGHRVSMPLFFVWSGHPSDVVYRPASGSKPVA